MTKNKALKIVNVVLLVLLINQAATGMLGINMSATAFEWLHRRAALLLIAATVVHLVLNWNWIKASYFKKN